MPAPPAPQPTLFVPHGAPTFALHPGPAGAALGEVARRLARPRAVVVVTAHWSTTGPTVGVAGRLETIHDYWRFPDELYSIAYPATGCPEAAVQVLDHLSAAGFASTADPTRGLDHGA